MFKYYIKVIIRNLLKIFWIFPIDKKKIYFQSFGGKSMNCNPRYIFKYMYEKYPDYKYVWLLNNEPEERLKGVTYVKKNTLQWVKEILTSKVLVANDGFFFYIPYRQKHILIETWHGSGAYKKVGMVLKNETNDKKAFDYISDHLTFFVSGCEKFTEIMSVSRCVKQSVFLPSGMPRNDLFFTPHLIQECNEKIREKYRFNSSDYIVLYAPTYRGTMYSAKCTNLIDLFLLKNTLKIKYQKEVKILFRGHYFLKNRIEYREFDKDVSDYPNMQELLCATDMLITDYSSSMWDYSFLYRPCFLFTPDIDEYIKDRGFYTDPYSWGFPICKTNEELAENIQKFDEPKFVAAMKKHHGDLGSYENGTATEKVCKNIKKFF
ncbi:MAG: CDP-glycerol glycerophosphotransferase family protein [Bacteroidales bacterium]|nr:CDP-glycerol glycerophosphotransferase family protein [Bacteroidales bacterium]